jgi:hypothetical protein
MDGEYSLATATLADIMPELQEKIQVQPNQCFASGMFIPDPNFIISDPGSKKIPDPGFKHP